ncbi:MAG: enolase C-terminal domain-like protein [Rubrivivax sp.]
MSSRTVHAREYVIVTVQSDSGARGTGYTYAGTTGARAVRDIVLHTLVPTLARPAGARHRGCVEGPVSRRPSSSVGAALHCDQSPRSTSRYSTLSSRACAFPWPSSSAAGKTRCRRTPPGGYYRAGDPVRAARARDRTGRPGIGLQRPRSRWGGRSVRDDAARVKLARELVGPEGLALDASNAYAHAAEAIEGPAAPSSGPPRRWVCGGSKSRYRPRTWPATRGLPRRSKRRWPPARFTRLRWDFRALVERGAAAIVQADAAVVGGISEWRRIAGLCAAFDLPMAPHWHHNLHVHLAACTPNCIVVEHFDLAKDVFNFERLLTPGSRALPEGGFLPVPSGPGLGIEFDAEAIERFRLP